jgi:anti-sigma factor RsiW
MLHPHRTDLLSAYLDHELGPLETSQVECQLASCEICQEIYTLYEWLNVRLRGACLCVSAPKELADRIRAFSLSVN